MFFTLFSADAENSAKLVLLAETPQLLAVGAFCNAKDTIKWFYCVRNASAYRSQMNFQLYAVRIRSFAFAPRASICS